MPNIHRLADVGNCEIGVNTRVWQYAVILPGAQLGANCNICAHTFIEGNVRIGNNVTLKCGVFLWDGTRIEDDVFIGPNATFTNDPMPRSKVFPTSFSGVKICRGASVGANATLLPGITVGEYAMIGAGAVVTKDVDAYTVVIGNPAKVIRRLQHG
ncbi:acyltransferase [Pseudomonas sp.]|uniref:acyltransferase n=1 Tax=Pseudomonas sp. TaxID=306 RepID=UPI003FD8CE49